MTACNSRHSWIAVASATAAAIVASPAIATPPPVDPTPETASNAVLTAAAPTPLDHFEPSSATADALTLDSEAWIQSAGFSSETTDGPAARELEIAQAPYKNPSGRRNSSKFSYIGVGGAIGLSGGSETSLGDGGFSLMGKTGFTENISIHSASVFGDDSVSVLALTADFPVYTEGSEEERSVSVVPFVGAGLALSNLFKNDSKVGFALTGGVDVPLAYRLTATGRVAAGFFDDDTDVAIILGIGYTYTGFFK